MPSAKHDGDRKRQPMLSAIEGRVLVLDVLAMTSLALILDTSDRENAKIVRGVLYLIREAVDNRCEEMTLSDDAAESARQYVEQWVQTAMATLFPEKHWYSKMV